MNIFEYFDEQERDIEKKLVQVTECYDVWTRELVFDQVKLICDEIMGHLKKQSSLLLKNLNHESPGLKDILLEAQKDHRLVDDEIGQLTQVHVDEPGYDDCLKKLLAVLKQHIEFSRHLYDIVREQASKQEMDSLNAQFNNVLLHSTDLNSLQAS